MVVSDFRAGPFDVKGITVTQDKECAMFWGAGHLPLGSACPPQGSHGAGAGHCACLVDTVWQTLRSKILPAAHVQIWPLCPADSRGRGLREGPELWLSQPCWLGDRCILRFARPGLASRLLCAAPTSWFFSALSLLISAAGEQHRSLCGAFSTAWPLWPGLLHLDGGVQAQALACPPLCVLSALPWQAPEWVRPADLRVHPLPRTWHLTVGEPKGSWWTGDQAQHLGCMPGPFGTQHDPVLFLACCSTPSL